jgi:hypothetical protein
LEFKEGVRIEKERLPKEDGRYIVFYNFAKEEKEE